MQHIILKLATSLEHGYVKIIHIKNKGVQAGYTVLIKKVPSCIFSIRKMQTTK